MGRCSFDQLVKNASRSLIISRSRPLKFRLSSQFKSSTCITYYKNKNGIKQDSSSLLERFIKTTRSVNRFYKRTVAEYVPSSMLVRPERCEETDEPLRFYISMVGVGDEQIKISVEKNKTVTIIGEGDGVFEARKGFKKYVCYVDLPDIDSPVKYYTTRGIKANMAFNAGSVELVIPKLKQHEKQDVDDDQRNTFSLALNRTFSEDQDYNNEEENEDEEECCDCNKGYLSSFYTYMGSLRLPPIIKKYVNISSQRFISTLCDGNRHRLNLAIHSISNFIYTEGYTISTTRIKPTSTQETDEFLYYYFQMNGVMSHENVAVDVDYNQVDVEWVVYDEIKATHHVYSFSIGLQPQDSWYLKYNIRDIKAEFSQGEGAGKLKVIIPKFDAAQRMINDKKNEAGEFLTLREDAFVFDVKVNA